METALTFLCDAHLGRLARYLRMLGFDAAEDPNLDDAQLLARARREGRLLLSRDRRLCEQAGADAFRVMDQQPRAQLRELLAHFPLQSSARPLTRCLACNVPLAELSAVEAVSRIPACVARDHRRFLSCPICGRTYWEGSHYRRMQAFVSDAFNGSPT